MAASGDLEIGRIDQWEKKKVNKHASTALGVTRCSWFVGNWIGVLVYHSRVDLL